MQRLADLLASPDGQAEVVLVGGVDARGGVYLDCEVRARVPLVCQRCLTAVEVEVDIRRRLGVVATEAEADRLPEDREPLIVGPGVVEVSELVEDEVLLALPLIAAHDDAEQCRARGFVEPEAPAVEDRGGRGRQAFAGLAGWNRDTKA